MLEVDSLTWRTGQPPQTAFPVNADWTGQICAPSRSFGGENQISILPWPDSRALVREAGARLVWNCGAPPVEMDSRSMGLGRYESVAHASSVHTK